jgi:arylsulfatase A-like enzyme
LLAGQETVEAATLYWKSASGSQAAVLADGWKLIVDQRTGGQELFDMKNDPSETQNVAAKLPDRVRTLSRLLEQQMALDP